MKKKKTKEMEEMEEKQMKEKIKTSIVTFKDLAFISHSIHASNSPCDPLPSHRPSSFSLLPRRRNATAEDRD
jgi:hypothetical protein